MLVVKCMYYQTSSDVSSLGQGEPLHCGEGPSSEGISTELVAGAAKAAVCATFTHEGP